MLKRCELCGTEYASDAEYCNLCKKESLVAVDEPEPVVEPVPLVADPVTLVFVAMLWLLGLGYLIGEVRPRSWDVLAVAWGCLTAGTFAVSLAMRNPRLAAIFSLIGAVFCAIYGLLVL